MGRALGWSLLCFWAALGAAVQLALIGVFVGLLPALPGEVVGTVRAAVPDLATLLLVAAVGRLSSRDLLWIAVVVALGRSAFTAAPPLAVLSGSLATALLGDALRTVAELDRPFLRIVSAGLGALVYGYWLLFVDYALSREAAARGDLAFGWPDASSAGLPLVTAAATAAVALLAWPLFAGLPGLRKLERRAF